MQIFFLCRFCLSFPTLFTLTVMNVHNKTEMKYLKWKSYRWWKLPDLCLPLSYSWHDQHFLFPASWCWLIQCHRMPAAFFFRDWVRQCYSWWRIYRHHCGEGLNVSFIININNTVTCMRLIWIHPHDSWVNRIHLKKILLIPVFPLHLSLQQPSYAFPLCGQPWWLVHLVLSDFYCSATYSQPEPEDMPQKRQPEIHIIRLNYVSRQQFSIPHRIYFILVHIKFYYCRHNTDKILLVKYEYITLLFIHADK